MRKVLLTVGIVALAAVLASSAIAASRGASFTPLGLFDEPFPLTTVTDMTGDGQVIVGMHAFFSGGYIWTEDTGLNTVGPILSGMYTSRSGDLIASDYFEDPNDAWDWSAIWEGGFYPNTVWRLLPLADGFVRCGGSGQSTFGASENWVVGLTWLDEDGNGDGCDGARAFAWSEATGTIVLDDSISGDGSYRANAVNDDGSVITGWSAPGRTASAWIDNVETYLCTGDQADWFCNEGWDVTPSGDTILFTGASPTDFNVRASIYDVASGNVAQLPFPPAPGDPMWDTFQGWAISDDSNTVVGEFGGGGFFGSPPYPVVWVDGIGTIDLQVMLLGQGLDDLFFWFLSDASAVNSDGTIIAGSGINPDGWIEAYKVDISKVKVCHKPDGNGQGNDRTIAIGWHSVPDHLAHGDILATCEFASSDAGSRFASRRQQVSTNHEDQDGRMRSIENWQRIQGAVTGKTVEAPTSGGFELGSSANRTADDDYTPEQRRESLRQRVGRTPVRR